MSEVERIRPIAAAYGTVHRVEPRRDDARDKRHPHPREDKLELHETEEPNDETSEPKTPVETTVHLDLEV